MASYWLIAKQEAKKRARYSGYCWVYNNPTSDIKAYWKQPYLFYESEVNALPPWVPKDAIRFGEGPYVPPPYVPTIDDAMEEIKWLKREISRLSNDYP